MNVLPIALALLIPAIAIADDKKDAKPAPRQPPKAEPPAPTPPPAEVKSTVDAFKGNWNFDAEITAPGMEKPAKFKMTFNCKAVAGNTAVSCDAKAKTPMGPFEGLFVVVYDPFSKAVHFIGVTNQHEVHDHVCNWKGADLTCNPLKGGSGPDGHEVTEDVSMKFDKNMVSFTSVSKLKGGGQIKFEGKGKR